MRIEKRIYASFRRPLAIGMLAGALLAPLLHAERVPAFPGAEGAGKFTVGGRGGRVIEVTNLQDSGTGSLRAALEAAGPRTVVFRVSGIVNLRGPVHIDYPYLTVAGQTAPGDGICIRGATIEIDAHDVIMRYLRFRRGNLDTRDDCLNARHSTGNIIIDHCSFSWGLDENVSFYRYMKPLPNGKEEKLPIQNVTIQWCISSEALNLHDHAFGGTWGGRNVSFHHNLFACNTGRNPSIGWGDHVDFRNNVLFNWHHRTMDGGSGASTVNVVGNYFKPGPATKPGELQYRICKPQHLDWLAETKTRGGWYVADNFVVGNPKVSADNWAGGVQFDGAHNPDQLAALIKQVRADKPYAAVPINQQSAQEAYKLVLANAGDTLPVRDAVDKRIIEEVRTGKPTYEKGIIMRPSDVGGWPVYRSLPAPLDSDHDGMPDAWERRYGLDPNNPADGAHDSDHDGYTNLEEYLNGTNPRVKVDYTQPQNNRNLLP